MKNKIFDNLKMQFGNITNSNVNITVNIPQPEHKDELSLIEALRTVPPTPKATQATLPDAPMKPKPLARMQTDTRAARRLSFDYSMVDESGWQQRVALPAPRLAWTDIVKGEEKERGK